jgi:hypothetical protein
MFAAALETSSGPSNHRPLVVSAFHQGCLLRSSTCLLIYLFTYHLFMGLFLHTYDTHMIGFSFYWFIFFRLAAN